MNKEEKEFFYSIGRGSLNLNGKFYYGLDYPITDFMNSLEQENKKYKEIIDKAIKHVNKYESIKAFYEYIDEDGYDEYNDDEDFKKELLDILKEVK